MNLGDITQINLEDLKEKYKNKEVGLLTHGSPCQSFSLAGKQEGGDEDSGTKSSLMWNSVKVIEALTPKIVIWENVKNVVSKRHIHNFNKYLEALESFGYNNYYKILNAKNYEVPQNRERIFVVSIRKDIDNQKFKFPKERDLKILLENILEEDVDEKYFLDNDKATKLIFQIKDQVVELPATCDGSINDPVVKDVSNAIMARYDSGISNFKSMNMCVVEPKLDLLCTLSGGKWDKMMDISKRVYSEKGISPTIPTMSGGNTEPKVGVFTYRELINNRRFPSCCNCNKNKWGGLRWITYSRKDETRLEDGFP